MEVLLCGSVHAQSCLTLCNLMDCSPPGSSVHGIFQARTLEWVAISFSRGSSQLRDQTLVSCISCTARWILYPSLCHMRVSFCGYDGLNPWPLVFNSIFSPSPHPEAGDGAENSSLLIKPGSFWWPLPSWSWCTWSFSLAYGVILITPEMPRILETPLSGIGIKEHIWEQKMLLAPLTLRKLQGLRTLYRV